MIENKNSPTNKKDYSAERLMSFIIDLIRL